MDGRGYMNGGRRACRRVVVFAQKNRVALFLSAVPVALALFCVMGPFVVDTFYLYSGIKVGRASRVLPGYPTIDPNMGFTSFALGARAAFDILSGRLPLWNSYEGLGTPLLGEMQSAALFPPTLLLALPYGQVWEHAFLQLVAGWGSFLFFRQFGLGRKAALTGGILFELNGVFAWLRNAIYNPVAFLPWLFYAIELSYGAAVNEKPLRQRVSLICLGGTAAALALYAGFPEEVYLYSLLLLAWAVFRLKALPRPKAVSFLSDLALMAIVGGALSAPVLVAFIGFLDESNTGGHDGNGFYGIWLSAGALLQYVLPYMYGGIFAVDTPSVSVIWGSIGGYVGSASALAAWAGAFVPRRRSVKIFLALWVLLALSVSHGVPGIYQLFMLLPLAKIAACYRYLNAGWIFCVIFLAALFVDDVELLAAEALRRVMLRATGCLSLVLIGVSVAAAATLGDVWRSGWLARGFLVSSMLVGTTLFYSFWRIAGCAASPSKKGRFFAAILIFESIVWFLLPYLSYPRTAAIDEGLISFLRKNVGYQRVVNATDVALGANYGAYFGIPLLNYNDLPVPRLTVDYVKRHLDPLADPNIFAPSFPALPEDRRAERQKIFAEREARYAQAGVKYVLASKDFTPDGKLVYQGNTLSVYALENVRSYFSSDGCALEPRSFDQVEAVCPRPGKMTRLELAMPGWSATVNGRNAPVTMIDEAFQSVDLPEGRSVIHFSYVPSGFVTAERVSVAGMLFVLLGVMSTLGAKRRKAYTKPPLK